MDILDLGKTPISEQSPAGTDARSGPDIDALSAEVEKLSSPTSSGGVDWRKIADFSARILSEQSKDLLVACYLSTALFRMEGMTGLGKGVHVLKDLVDLFWETMFPPIKRMRARRNALEWWFEKTASAVNTIEPGSLPESEVAPVLEELKGLDRSIGDKMEDAPVLSGLLERIASLQAPDDPAAERKPEGSPPEVPAESRPTAPATPTEPRTVARAAPSPPAGREPSSPSLQSEEDANRALRSASQRLGELASFYLSRDLFHPLAYLLDRAAAWTPVIEPPPSDGSITLIPPPPDYVKTNLQDLKRKGDWENLLRAAEGCVVDFLFWLDLSRFVAESLDHLGRSDLGDVLSRETSLYAARLKGVEELCFSDGTPFADSETKSWLKRFSPGYDGNRPGKPSGDSQDTLEGSVEREYQKALQLFREQKLQEAVFLLHGHVGKASSGKERLLWRTALSNLLVFAGEEGTALPHLREIVREIDNYRIEEWEPGLALRALMSVYSGFASSKDERQREQTREILDRIAALDPAEAMRLK
ncbi:MAG: type VI secretion system protein TssA [Desulfobacteraceae bacterium]|nr:MAG: type VI secretion system protein TssA [Desulfobacteraceae bacterium]